VRLCLCALSQCEQALAKEAKRKQEEEKSRLEEMKRQEKKALEEADAARFRGKEAKEPKTLTQFQIYEQKTQREAQARAMARQEVRARAGRRARRLAPYVGARTRASSTWSRGMCRCAGRGGPHDGCVLWHHSVFATLQANPNHVLRDEAARAAEEGRDYVSARGVDQALQVRGEAGTLLHALHRT
jgi:hypothetical protein